MLLERPIRTNLSLFLHETADGLVISVNDRPSITVGGNWQAIARCLALVDGDRLPSMVAALAEDERTSVSDAIEILGFCATENLIEYAYPEAMVPSNDDEARDLLKWDRQIKNFATLDGSDALAARRSQQAIQDAHVAILGVGGVGTYLALSAAMMGVGRITIIDFDTIELSNTARQVLYSEVDVGESKVTVASEKLRTHNPRARVHALNQEILSDEDLRLAIDSAERALGPVDFLFVAADMPRGEIQYIVDRVCGLAGVAWMNLGPYGFSKVLMGPLIVPGLTASYAEYFPKDLVAPGPGDAVAMVNERFESNIMDPYNAICAKMGMVEAVKYLTGYTRPVVLGRAVELDTSNWVSIVHELD